MKKNKNKASHGASASKHKPTDQGEELTSKAQRRGLLGLPTPRPTTLGPQECLERLRRPRKEGKEDERQGGVLASK